LSLQPSRAVVLILLVMICLAPILVYSQPYSEESEYRGYIVKMLKDPATNAVFMHLLNEETLSIVPISGYVYEYVEEGDYVYVRARHVYTFTIVIDPILNTYITRASIGEIIEFKKLGEGFEVTVDRGCGSKYPVGEKVSVRAVVPIDCERAVIAVEYIAPPGLIGHSYVVLREIKPGYAGEYEAEWSTEGCVETPGSENAEWGWYVVLSAEVKLSMPYVNIEEVTITDRCKVVLVSGADLRIENVVAEGLAECTSGTVRVVVSNSGKKSSPSTKVEVRLSGKVIGSAIVPQIEPGSSVEVEVPVSVPCCVNARDLLVVVDPGAEVEEIDKENNAAAVEGAVALVKPELAVKIAGVESEEEGRVVLRVTVTNVGKGEARDVRLAWSSSGTARVRVEPTELGLIAPGGTAEAKVYVEGPPGKYSFALSITTRDACGREWSFSSSLIARIRRKLALEVRVEPETTEALSEVRVVGQAPREAAGLELRVVARRTGGKWVELGRARVLPDGTFTFTFRPAKAGDYEVGVYYPGDDIWSEALVYRKLRVTKIKTTLELVVSEKAPPGSPVTIKGKLLPPRETEGFLELESPAGETKTIKFRTAADGTFEVTVLFNATGRWRVAAKVPGNEAYEDAGTETFLLIFPLRPPVSLEVVAATIVTGTAIGVASTLSPARRAISSIARKLEALLERLGIKPPEWLRELASVYAEEAFESVAEKEIPLPSEWRLLTLPELKTLIGSSILVWFVYAYVETQGKVLVPQVLLEVIIPVVVASLVVVMMDAFSEALISKLRGFWAVYSFWPQGALSMLVTGLLLNSPFAAPGRTLFGKGYPRFEKARLAAYKALFFLAIAGGFAVATIEGLEVLSDSGLLASLAFIFYSLFPVKPLLGYELASQRKTVWLVFFLLTGALYVSCLTKFLAPYVYVAVGCVAALLLGVDFVLVKLGAEGIISRIV